MLSIVRNMNPRSISPFSKKNKSERDSYLVIRSNERILVGISFLLEMWLGCRQFKIPTSRCFLSIPFVFDPIYHTCTLNQLNIYLIVI